MVSFLVIVGVYRFAINSTTDSLIAAMMVSQSFVNRVSGGEMITRLPTGRTMTPRSMLDLNSHRTFSDRLMKWHSETGATPVSPVSM
ncbi:MAG: hypothetical protein DRQ59_13195 [Gammaproteobacteria bacterium]|nr:MAG: hypothetical protein DRQ59_13195 [Gammaproteobacteria bacterium]